MKKKLPSTVLSAAHNGLNLTGAPLEMSTVQHRLITDPRGIVAAHSHWYLTHRSPLTNVLGHFNASFLYQPDMCPVGSSDQIPQINPSIISSKVQ